MLQTETQDQRNSFMFNSQFYIEKKLSSGTFGVVFLCQNIQTMEYVAMKVEKNQTEEMNSLSREVKILQDLQQLTGIPKLIWYGKDHGHNCLVLQLLGKDLAQIVKNYKKLTLQCTVNVAIQILHIIQGVHKRGIVHRDIKPENIMIGRGNEINQIYLADFGISKHYKDTEGNHIPLKEKKQFVGTTRYASLNAHNGIELSRRDDLESIGYVLLYLLKGSLPWQIVRQVRGIDKAKRVGEIKSLISIKELCVDLPGEFVQYLSYVRDLQFQETPDYKYLFRLFRQIAAKFEFRHEQVLDWTECFALKSATRESKQSKGSKKSIESHQPFISNHITHKLHPDATSLSKHSENSSINLNYKDSQFSEKYIKLGSSKLMDLLHLQDRNPMQRIHDQCVICKGRFQSSKNVVQQNETRKPSNSVALSSNSKQKSQLDSLEGQLDQERQNYQQHNYPQSLMVKRFIQSNSLTKDITLTGILTVSEEELVSQKVEEFHTFQSKFKEELAPKIENIDDEIINKLISFQMLITILNYINL